MSKEELVKSISDKLIKNMVDLKRLYNESNPHTSTKYFVIDDLLNPRITSEIFNSFPNKDKLNLRDTFREKKYTSQNFDSELLNNITDAFQDPVVIKVIENVTSIDKLINDPSLYAGGISRMEKGHFLNPHIDNSHNGNRSLYRRLNLLFYVTPNYRQEYGGNFELWDKKVRKPLEIPSYFNRLVVMETTNSSWHSVSPVLHDVSRCCVSNYFFTSESPDKNDYYHVTSFLGRPEEKLKRLYGRLDNFLRNTFATYTGISRGRKLIRK